MKRILLVLVLIAAGALDARAQAPQVVLRGRGDPDLDAQIRRVLREPGREVWTRDTLLARNDTVRAPLLIVGATVRLEGTLLSDVVGIGADIFVRPSARLLGGVQNIAGGWYASELATVAGGVRSEPNAPYEVSVADGQVRIVGTEQPRFVKFEPVIPTYDRVDGLSLGGGIALLAPPLGRLQPALRGWGVYRSERGQVDPGVEARLERGTTSLSAGAERTTLTNEQWIRSALPNSVRYLWSGKDYRDYYQAERAWVELRRTVERGPRTSELWVRGQVEDAASLHADDPWSVLRPDSVRPNGGFDPERGAFLSADEGRSSSLWLGGNTEWERPTFMLELDARTELAFEVLDADHAFSRYELTGGFAMLALRDHTLDIEAHFRGPLLQAECRDCIEPSHRIPRQRWSYVGGSGTLYTFDDAQFRGDRVAFVETVYAIPLGPRFRMKLLGIPSLELMHMTGMAWTEGERRAFEHNVGLRLRYSMAFLRVVTNPEAPGDDVEFSAGVSLPKHGYPWQRSQGFF